MTDWIILRTNSSNTLKLAGSLAAAGFEAWSPVETVTLRARRSHPQEQVTEPLMDGYVFVPLAYLNEMIELSHSPSLTYLVWDSEQRRMVLRGHPYFWLMPDRAAGTAWATTPDAHLAHLRKLERRRRPKGKVKEVHKGQRVRMSDGAYEGLYGVVTECGSAYTEVLIDGWNFPVKISTWLLHPELDGTRPVHVSGSQSELARRAKAA